MAHSFLVPLFADLVALFLMITFGSLAFFVFIGKEDTEKFIDLNYLSDCKENNFA